jgi:hypothetical protein
MTILAGAAIAAIGTAGGRARIVAGEPALKAARNAGRRMTSSAAARLAASGTGTGGIAGGGFSIMASCDW